MVRLESSARAPVSTITLHLEGGGDPQCRVRTKKEYKETDIQRAHWST